MADKLKSFSEAVIDYVISLTHLYGLVHRDKVVEIFNRQNKEKTDITVMKNIMDNPPEELAENFVEFYGDYFVHETIMEFDDFTAQLKQRRGNHFMFIPGRTFKV